MRLAQGKGSAWPSGAAEWSAKGLTDELMGQEIENVSVEERAAALNALLSSHTLNVMVDPVTNAPVYKLLDAGEAVIKAAGNMGIWTRDMKQKTNLAQPKINKILKALEERALVKHVKSVQNASRKVYMLSELEPAKEITGGPWYGPDSFDSEFIAVLRDAAYGFIRKKGEASLEEITAFIASTGVSRQALQPEDMAAIVNTLGWDGKVEERENAEGEVVWRQALVTIPESTPFTSIPCGTCPVIGECTEGGPISPETCTYYQARLEGGHGRGTWLKMDIEDMAE
eukprot:scaffold5.g997.t1